MKKKLLMLVCMLTCILGLTACGKEETVSNYQQSKISYAEQMVNSETIPLLLELTSSTYDDYFISFNNEELERIILNQFGVSVDGNGIRAAVASFKSGLETTGDIIQIGDITTTVDGKELIINADVTGSLKNAQVEIIISNDMFLILQSASLNPTSTMGDLMAKAGLNTLLGMGTVFCVLILISLLISLFKFIPKIQKVFADKKAGKTEAEVKPQQPIEVVEENEDDTELVAVIAAAIAAYEGSSGTDGFVVRSIRRR